jgi:hypothetical protein
VREREREREREKDEGERERERETETNRDREIMCLFKHDLAAIFLFSKSLLLITVLWVIYVSLN